MDITKKYPQAPESAEGCQYIEEGNVGIKDTSANVSKQALAELFSEPRWVPYQLKLSTTTPGKLDKIPHTGKHGLSTKKPAQWMPLEDAAELAQHPDLNGVGLVMTGGIDSGDWRLVGLDFDDVNFDKFTMPFKTYAERSPSGKGVRAFIFVPLAFAAKYRDTMDARPPNCAHAEVYLGTTPRFLTTTFDVIDDHPIARIDDPAQLERLEAWGLNKFEVERPLILPDHMGEVLNVGDYTTEEPLLEVATGNCEGEDRSPRVHALMKQMFNLGATPEDVLATVADNPHLSRYLLDHRHNDGASAMKFAMEEVGRAWTRSVPGMLESLASFAKPKADAAAPEDDFAPYVADDWDDDSAIDYMIYGYLENDVKALLYGPPGSCKTFLALDIAGSVASGKPWHGRDVMRPGPVLYICGEARKGVRRRLKVLCQTRGIGRDVKIRISRKPIALARAAEASWLHQQIAKFDQPPVLIIVDTLARNFGGNENSAEDMGLYTDSIDMLRRETGATVLTVHHTGYDGKHPRGSTALFASTDAVYRADYDKAKDSLLVTVERLKDEEGGEIIGFTPKVTHLKGADGQDVLDIKDKPITSLVLQSGSSERATREAKFFEAHPSLKDSGTSKFAERLPQVLRQAFYDHGTSGKDFARKYSTAIGAEKPVAFDSLKPLVERLIREGLMEDDGRKLTEAGRQAAGVFNDEIRLILLERTRGVIPFPPPKREDLL